MSQQPQQRNLLLFFLLVSLLLFLYIPLRQHSCPQADPKNPDEPAAGKKDDPKKDEGPVVLPTPPPATPEAELARLELGSAEPDSKFHLRVVLDPLGGGVH